MEKTVVYGSFLITGGELSEISSYVFDKNCQEDIYKQTFALQPTEFGNVEYIFRKINDKLIVVLNFSSNAIDNKTIIINDFEDLYDIFFYEDENIKLYIPVNLDCSFWYCYYAEILGKISGYEDLFVKFVEELKLEDKEYSIFNLAHVLFADDKFANNISIIQNKRVLKLLCDRLSTKYSKIKIEKYLYENEIKTEGIDSFNSIIGGLIIDILGEILYNDSYLKSDYFKLIKKKIINCCAWHQVIHLQNK